ncbi:MAG: radical SAM protein [Candidatus Eremiobacteraeota bacterium]|nr:radical SAM protein [Candidatus Eremiobacteraeota bacterium]
MLMSLPVRENRPLVPVTTFMVYVTEECNLRCTYCFVKKQPRHMTFETAKKVVDYCLQPEVSGQECIGLNFFGGEPLLRSELLLDLLGYLRTRPRADRVVLGVTTNGTLAGESVRRFVQEGEVQLLISLDGDEASHHFRPKVSGGNSWGHLRRNLNKLISWSPSSSIRMTFHPGSLNLLDKVLAAQELGAGWILLAPVVEADWSQHHEELRMPSERLADWFISEFRAGKIAALHHYWSCLLQYHLRYGTEERPAKACPLGTSLLAFDTAGNILPCHRYLYRKHERFGVAGRQLGLPPRRWDYVHLSRAQIPDCATCIARTVCAGGCRVIPLEAGLGLNGVHPNQCLLNRELVLQVDRIYQELRGDPQFLATVLSQQEMPLMFQEARPISEEV